MSAVVLQDYIRPFCPCEITDFKAMVITKVTAAVLGLSCIGLAFVASKLGSVMQMSYAVFSAIDGPLFGAFILGMFFPRANTIGAITGYVFALGFMFWIAIGSFFYNASTPVTSFSVSGCNWNVTNTTTSLESANVTLEEEEEEEENSYPIIYRLSYIYYTITGAFITVVIGIIASLISGYGKPVKTDPDLICPVVDILFPCLPDKFRKKFQYSLVSTQNVETEPSNINQQTKIDESELLEQNV